jgi:hypothetical protein
MASDRSVPHRLSNYHGGVDPAPPESESNAVRRLAEAMGRPVPPEPTPEQVAEFVAAQNRADEEIIRFYGLSDRTVA